MWTPAGVIAFAMRQALRRSLLSKIHTLFRTQYLHGLPASRQGREKLLKSPVLETA
jgi:hypothetical protein